MSCDYCDFPVRKEISTISDKIIKLHYAPVTKWWITWERTDFWLNTTHDDWIVRISYCPWCGDHLSIKKWRESQ